MSQTTVPHRPAFTREELLQRIDKIQFAMRAEGIGALIVRDIANFYYVTGMDQVAEHDFFCAIVPATGEPSVLLNVFQRVLYEHAANQFEARYYAETEDPRALLQEIVAARTGQGSVQGDAAAAAEGLCHGSRNASSAAVTVVERVRMCKTVAEVALMKQAARYSDIGAAAGLETISVGAADREIATASIAAMIRAGSAFPPLAPIVAAGYRGGIPYSTFDDAVVADQSSVFLELTGTERHYVAPLMRTAAVGEMRADVVRAVTATSRAVEAICEVARPGANSQEVVAAAMKHLAPELDGVLFHHIIAYPVGIAFPPSWVEQVVPGTIKHGNEFTLRAGMTFHLPMSLRKQGEWAVGLSQTIHIGEDATEPFSQDPAAIHRVDV